MKTKKEKIESIKKRIKEKERLYARSRRIGNKYLDELDKLWDRLEVLS
jgi:hypothetical protein